MSNLLALAADYIERMANPAFGVVTNENYAIQFGELLEIDGFTNGLREEIETLDDPRLFSSHGWIWLFEWVRANEIRLNHELLSHLFHEWESPFIRSEIFKLGTNDFESDFGAGPRNRRMNLSDFPQDGFIAQIVIGVTTDRIAREQLRAARGQSVLVALLQAGSATALDVASALLNYQWDGQQNLLRFFGSLVEGLDTETRNVWVERLNPPHFDFNV